MSKQFGRRSEGIKAYIRDIGTLRPIAEDRAGLRQDRRRQCRNPALVPVAPDAGPDWRDVIDNNLNGTANTVRAFAPKMVARKKSRFILLSSMQGTHGTKLASNYSASKWGILGLMKSAAIELGEHNITVNALIPGLVDTALTRYEKRLSETKSKDRRWTIVDLNDYYR
jgi:NAD(P)-dependent dehydrogenase (short-subunit alcohol dehydrogenase family)